VANAAILTLSLLQPTTYAKSLQMIKYRSCCAPLLMAATVLNFARNASTRSRYCMSRMAVSDCMALTFESDKQNKRQLKAR
jgi:hypothetical protein